MVEVGSCNGEVTENILHLMMNPDHAGDLTTTTHSRFLALALGLLYLGVCVFSRKGLPFL